MNKIQTIWQRWSVSRISLRHMLRMIIFASFFIGIGLYISIRGLRHIVSVDYRTGAIRHTIEHSHVVLFTIEPKNHIFRQYFWGSPDYIRDSECPKWRTTYVLDLNSYSPQMLGAKVVGLLGRLGKCFPILGFKQAVLARDIFLQLLNEWGEHVAEKFTWEIYYEVIETFADDYNHPLVIDLEAIADKVTSGRVRASQDEADDNADDE